MTNTGDISTSAGPDALQLADYLAVARRRWRIVLVLTCLGLFVAGADAVVTATSYSASASVYVAQLAIDNSQALGGTTTSPVNMDNEAQIVQSQAVAELAARRLHLPVSPAQLVKRVGVTVAPNTTVLDINCQAPTAGQARTCADAFAVAYLSVRLHSATSTALSAVSALQAKLNVLARRIAALTASPPAGRSSRGSRITTLAALTVAHTQLGALGTQLNVMLPALTSLQAPNNALAGHVIDSAIRPASASSPRTLLLLPSGLLGGLVIGLLAAFFAEHRDGRLHAPRDVERFLDLPVLVLLETERADTGIVPVLPRSRAGQAFSELARHAAVVMGDASHGLLVAGASPGAGAGVIAGNLAVAFATTRSDATLVCAAPRDSVIPRLFGVSEGPGVAELLTGSAAISEVAHPAADVADLRVIGPGRDRAPSDGNLRRDVIRGLMAELRACAPCVIIEARPVGEGSDAFNLAEFTDAAIVAIEAACTTRADAIDCVRRLEGMGTTVLGAAMIAVPTQRGNRRWRLRMQPSVWRSSSPTSPRRAGRRDDALGRG